MGRPVGLVWMLKRGGRRCPPDQKTLPYIDFFFPLIPRGTADQTKQKKNKFEEGRRGRGEEETPEEKTKKKKERLSRL
jgi:hypothetical protein